MSTEQQQTYRHPFAGLYRIDGNAIVAMPEYLPALAGAADRTGMPDLVIVSGPLAHPAAGAQAVQIARRQMDGALLVAVVQAGEESVAAHTMDLHKLHAAFQAVVVVAGGRRLQVEARLVRTVLGPAGQEQWIGCDWSDICHMLETSRGSLVRYGSGRAAGDGRAAAAVRDAVAQADRQGSGLRTARGVCVGIRSAADTLYGKDIRVVMDQIRARVGRDATITMSGGPDGSLEDGVLEVDVFAFGEAGAMDDAGYENGDDAAAGPAFCQDREWNAENGSPDPLYAAARALVERHQRASVSLVQRHLRIGYNRASQLLDALEGDVLSARREDGTRTVLTGYGRP